MFAQPGLILVVIAVTFALAKWRKLSVEISMLLAALAGILVFGIDPVIGRDIGQTFRHIVEGSFTYFDVCLIFITATFFMNILKESGGIAFIVRKIVVTFHNKKTICLILLTFVLLVPGAITGSGAATVLTVGAMVGTVLAVMGISEMKTAAIIFLCSAMSAAAPPVNLWAMMTAAGSNMPYVGFMLPLLVLSVTGALFSMFFLARKSKPILLEKALESLPEPVKGMNFYRVGIPFFTLLALILVSRIFPFQTPVIGLPMVFVISSIVAMICSPKKLKILQIAENTVHSLLPLVGIMVIVGILIQVMAYTGARGLISLAVVTLPIGVLFATLFLILPVSEGLLQYAVGPLIGVPLIMLFNMEGFNPIIVLSAMSVMWPLGDALPPTAIVGKAAVMELKFTGSYYKEFLKSCLIPMGFILLLCTILVIFSNQFAFLVGG